MRFLVDECADARLAIHLRGLGHDATTIAADYTRSLRDEEVLAIAFREGRVLITNDRDFGELVFRFGQAHAGVIYLRLGTTSLAAKIERLNHVLTDYGDRLREFLVVDDRRVRVRHTGLA